MKLISSIITACILTMFAFNANAQDLRGPKIFGLQLGMPMDEAKNIINELASKSGLTKEQFDLYVSIDEYNSEKDGKLDKYIFFAQISGNIFNVDSFLDPTFLQKLCDTYNIPELRNVGNGEYEYKDNDSGYIVEVSRVWIRVYKIKKSSEARFE